MKYFIAKRLVPWLGRESWCVYMRRESWRPVAVAGTWDRCVLYVLRRLKRTREL